MSRVFVMRPFGKKKDSSGAEFDFENTHNLLIEPAIDVMDFTGSTTGEIVEPGNIREDMFALIVEADLVICDITIYNPNVYYELGIRHALRKKRTILIRDESSADKVNFDLLTDRYLAYDSKAPEKTKDKLVEMIKAAMISSRETDSPVFKLLPKLLEVDPDTIQTLPLDFLEEVQRARTAGSKGWLRLLTQDVYGLRFQWLAMKRIAEAQWELKDYAAARETLEAIRHKKGETVSVNLMLANVCERLYKTDKKPTRLLMSNQAIERVLGDRRATRDERVEALALKGRNLKTLWRENFELLVSVEERRAVALSKKIRASYEAYRDAFDTDLNHFYSGLAALQMGIIFLDLSAGNDDSWKNIFDSDEAADYFRTRLVNEVKTLETVVSASIEMGLNRLASDDGARLWAEISKADLLFLKDSREQRIIDRYTITVPADNPFAWDAARGQLELFKCLNIKSDLADKIINAVNSRQKYAPKKEKRTHLVMFAGHRIDLPNRSESRFPAGRENEAKKLIADTLAQISNPETDIIGLASMAPGADIIFHETCQDLNISTLVCLPMPSAKYIPQIFKGLYHWKNRYLKLKENNKFELLELSDQEGLPNWLTRKDVNPWERGNRWVLQMGLTSEADKITLIAFWDGNPSGDARGGTAHMVEICERVEEVNITIIDSKQLL